LGSGTGLLGKYWPNTSSAAFISPLFTNLPTLVRTDATVNFNWAGVGPDPSIGNTNYAVRWSGTVQPQFSEPYTFYTTADDGVRLYVNGQLLIDNWLNQAATTRSNTIPLVAQQLYNIQLDYFYNNDSGAQVALSWSSPSTTRAIIPQSQLYPYANPPPTIVIASPADGAVYTGTASVTIGANADAPYNPISTVAFYANNSWLGTLSNSPYAPLYALTSTGFLPNAGGETANSGQVSAKPAASVNLVTTNTQGGGTAGWNVAIWQTNNGAGVGSGPFVGPPASGNTCTAIFNGTQVGNALNSTGSPNNTRVRNPTGVLVATFPGDSLTLTTNTELREKEGSTAATLVFPGPAGGGPGLILNGGILNCGEPGTFTITGAIQVASQSYICNGANGAGGGFPAAGDNRQWNIAGQLSGAGTLVVMDCQMALPQIISGNSNTFSGQWIVQCGWLRASGINSLGTNSITVDPNYTGYLGAMPNATSPNGPALLEPTYDLNSAGTLTLVNGGKMNLHQNCAFSAVSIEGTFLSAGTHPYSELIANFPNSFSTGGSGAITVTGPPAPGGPPGPPATPTGLSAVGGNTSVTLSWNASAGATSYNVKRSTNNGGPYTTIATVTGTSYTDSGLANGTTYYYVVSALSVPGYILMAVATDASGLSSTSAPVHITVNPGSGLPYGLASRASVSPFLNMPGVIPAIFPGTLPVLLSGTGAFTNTPNRSPAAGLIPYAPNTPLWSDAAVKSRYMAVPNNGGLLTPDEQLGFLPTNSWTFPSGTVFVKNFDLVVNETNAGVPLRRLETRLLVRDNNGAVYGVTYKWRPDNSDADLLATSLSEDLVITNAVGIRTQTWYYPSPADCLTCHTPVANYVLGLNTRQLNGDLNYPATGQTDNQLRTLNRLGLFYPGINEASIANYSRLSSLTNLSASLEQRSRSYLDANCAQCHQPGGSGITFDARYDTPLANQNITNFPAAFSLG
ncbi:MAG TPA: PA14 domain-containing protein, partial [Methylomirabilota bacterium]|nr:PA14 domain-containing protein [Methylomirabilota bacterium]